MLHFFASLRLLFAGLNPLYMYVVLFIYLLFLFIFSQYVDLTGYLVGVISLCCRFMAFIHIIISHLNNNNRYTHLTWPFTRISSSINGYNVYNDCEHTFREDNSEQEREDAKNLFKFTRHSEWVMGQLLHIKIFNFPRVHTDKIWKN